MQLLGALVAGHDLIHEAQEVGARVAGRGHAVDATRGHLKRGVERESPMPIVLEAMTFRAPRRERQHRIESVQGLDRRLLIHTEHASHAGERR